MTHVILSFHLRTVAHADREVTLEVEGLGGLKGILFVDRAVSRSAAAAVLVTAAALGSVAVLGLAFIAGPVGLVARVRGRRARVRSG